MVGLKTPPSFKARRGSFKKRARNLPREVDFFGRKYASAMGKFLDAVQEVGGDAEATFVLAVGDLYDRIQVRTPVDTGAARAGWSIGWRGHEGNRHAVISNSVPYIVYLEFGWSKQAPKGMVRISLAEASNALVKSARRLLG